MPLKDEALLYNVGNVEDARKIFLESRPKNLEYLLQKRYGWMNDFLSENQVGFEVGAGAGLSKCFIENKNLLLTDYSDCSWLDQKVDALSLPYSNSSYDYIIESNVLHHLAFPMKFFSEAYRVLKPGGVLLIQDVWGSLLLRALLKYFKTEGYSYSIDVFSRTKSSCDESNLWAGNNVMPNILFDDMDKLERESGFQVIKFQLSECLIFPLSGGVTTKISVPQLPYFILKIVDLLDGLLIKIAPNIFALQVRAVFKKPI